MDELSLLKSVLIPFLCMLLDESRYHLEDAQFADQNNTLSYQGLSSQIPSLNIMQC